MKPKNVSPWSTSGNKGETRHLTQLLWSGTKSVLTVFKWMSV